MNEARQMILEKLLDSSGKYNHSRTVYTENIIWYCH